MEPLKIKDRVYAIKEIKEPLVLEIIQTPIFQRLKGIHQHDAFGYFFLKQDVDRFEHSLGAYFLLGLLGASEEDRIVGLLHDVSVATFTHVLDYLFRKESFDYHEQFHWEVIENSKIGEILLRYNFSPKVIADLDSHFLVDKNLPALCADRIDYFLRDACLIKIISKSEISEILSHLLIYKNEIVFDELEPAFLFAQKYLEIDKKMWAHPKNVYIYMLASKLFKLAFDKNIISEKETLTMTDDEIMAKITESQDQSIKEIWEKFSQIDKVVFDTDDYEFFMIPKARYVDPLIISKKGGPQRLSELIPAYKKEIKKYGESLKKGYFLRRHKNGENYQIIDYDEVVKRMIKKRPRRN